MFIFFYLIIVVCVLGFFVWSAVVVQDQKRAWRKFAVKRGLTYKANSFMEAARVQGRIDGIVFSLFSDTQRTPDVRGERHVSVLEFELGAGMPTGAAIGTPEMRPFINGLSFTEDYLPIHTVWKGEYVARCRDGVMLGSYLTDARIEALARVFGMNKVSALYFFDEQDAILHLETVDPLRDPVKLDRIIERLLGDAKKLLVDKIDAPMPVPVHSVAVVPETPFEPVTVDEPATLPPASTPTL